jgi:site-specific DNA recombinase
MMNEPRDKVALYARISEDDLGTEAGVRRQLEDGRQLAAARGWTVVAEFSDNDISAYNGKVRAGYRDLMAGASRREFSRIVCYHTSRLWRSRPERAEAIGALAEAGVSVVAVKGPDLDLGSAYGRGLAGLMGEFDTLESEVKGERVARAALQRARDGRANGVCPYGWVRVYERDQRGEVTSWRDEVDEDAAAVVRDIVERLLAGDSLRAIRDDLNARGVPTPQGRGEWRTSSVRKLALRPGNVADRTHHGKVIGPAAWPPIVDRDKHDRVTALLTDPGRVRSRDGARKHLLTYGIGECGVCGAVLRAVAKRRGERVFELYVCDDKGCVGRSRERVDELVSGVVVARLAQPDALDLLGPDEQEAAAATERAEGLRARLDLAADQYADGILDGRQLERITAKLRPQLEAAEREARQARAGAQLDVLDGLTGADAAAAWDWLEVGPRRAVLQVLGIRVSIMPTRQGPGFVPSDVHIEWKAGT